MNALVIGATGLCGSAILKYATNDCKLFSNVYSISRREIPNCGDSVKSIINEDTETWIDSIPDGINVLFSALGTTKAAAGSIENQYKIDHGLNLAVAKAAKEKGCKTLVLVSSLGASIESRLPYFKMKGELERDVLALGFERTILLRPGVLLGERDSNYTGFGRSLITKLASWIYRGKLQYLLGCPVYADEVGKVAVKLSVDDGTDKNKVKIVHSSGILETANSD
ncbi:Fmp52p Ecym_4479 [Eremothecium cymbalariae DBVPG|uniref:Protein FMP52, mitochondrial n=1 Tax=Eremothecium cymbalariae (strain CBS 270.75 / DBVPG 7215 / KCTC 17166 / NRRL Y-17582) TaxID=931890 RepID=G8JU16_ERECY|nr:hypothetical protein Ecym_4479 [Eremothecium cymbalariae DBVPG\